MGSSITMTAIDITQLQPKNVRYNIRRPLNEFHKALLHLVSSFWEAANITLIHTQQQGVKARYSQLTYSSRRMNFLKGKECFGKCEHRADYKL